MILPDVNLLIYAHNEAAVWHEAAQAWWEQLLNGDAPVGLPWAVIYGFIRLTTHPAVLAEPLDPAAAVERVEGWLAQDPAQILDPGPRHMTIARHLFETTRVGGDMTTDTHLAALAIEHQCELHSNDTDFSRFPGLKWHNPLAGR